MPAGRRAALRVKRQHPRALRAVAPHRHGCAQRHGRSRGRGCTAQQLAGCADGWCCEHRCHEGGACAARGRCVCDMAQAARVEPAAALHVVGAGSIDSESTLQRKLPKEFILIFINIQINYSLTVRKLLCVTANRKLDIIKTRLGSSNSNLPKALKITFYYSANVDCKITNPNKLGIIVQCIT